MKAKARFVPDAFPPHRAGRCMPRPDTSGSRSRETLLRSAEEIDEVGNGSNVRDLVSDFELSSARPARTPNPPRARNADRAKRSNGLYPSTPSHSSSIFYLLPPPISMSSPHTPPPHIREIPKV